MKKDITEEWNQIKKKRAERKKTAPKNVYLYVTAVQFGTTQSKRSKELEFQVII
jgi:hypothetical protein